MYMGPTKRTHNVDQCHPMYKLFELRFTWILLFYIYIYSCYVGSSVESIFKMSISLVPPYSTITPKESILGFSMLLHMNIYKIGLVNAINQMTLILATLYPSRLLCPLATPLKISHMSTNGSERRGPWVALEVVLGASLYVLVGVIVTFHHANVTRRIHFMSTITAQSAPIIVGWKLTWGKKYHGPLYLMCGLKLGWLIYHQRKDKMLRKWWYSKSKIDIITIWYIPTHAPNFEHILLLAKKWWGWRKVMVTKVIVVCQTYSGLK